MSFAEGQKGNDSRTGREPVVSVIITTYYRNDNLKLAIQSARNQTYEHVEIIVVDDSGESHAKPIVEQYEDIIYVTHEEEQGPNTARTTGFNKSNGEYIHFLDDDDQLLPPKLEQSVAKMQTHDQVGVVYSAYKWGDSIKTANEDMQGDVLKQLLRDLRFVPCVPSTMLIRREVLETMVPLQPRKCAEGLTMRIELARRTNFEYVDDALVDRQISEDSRSNDNDTTLEKIRIISEYKDLYMEVDADLMHRNLYRLYTERSLQILKTERWSREATTLGMKSVYHMSMAKEMSLKTIGTAVSSVFGKPGYHFVRGTKAVIRKFIH